MNDTKLRIEFYERTKDNNFTEALDDLLEDDYVGNRELYTDEIFSKLELAQSLVGDENPQLVMDYVKNNLNT
jgi:hypothetical protein